MKIMLVGNLLFRQVFEKEETQSVAWTAGLCSCSYDLKTNVLKVIKAKIQYRKHNNFNLKAAPIQGN